MHFQSDKEESSKGKDSKSCIRTYQTRLPKVCNAINTHYHRHTSTNACIKINSSLQLFMHTRYTFMSSAFEIYLTFGNNNANKI